MQVTSKQAYVSLCFGIRSGQKEPIKHKMYKNQGFQTGILHLFNDKADKKDCNLVKNLV
jgi:hypothetical protein